MEAPVPVEEWMCVSEFKLPILSLRGSLRHFIRTDSSFSLFCRRVPQGHQCGYEAVRLEANDEHFDALIAFQDAIAVIFRQFTVMV